MIWIRCPTEMSGRDPGNLSVEGTVGIPEPERLKGFLCIVHSE